MANLDSLRALAVLLVLVDHLMLTLEYAVKWNCESLSRFSIYIGQAGVIAFFVHTSLVLMHSLDRLKPADGHIAIRFYVRRAFRIYPLSICCIVAAVTLGLPAKTWKAPETITGPVIASNLLLVQNLWTKQSVIGPLWSLPYEVQMYLVLPLLYLVANMRHGRIWLILLIIMFSIVGVSLAVTVGRLNIAAYIPCFLAGVLSYSLSNKQRILFSARLWIPFLLAAVAVYCLVHWSAEAPIYWVGWLFALVLGVSIHLFRQADQPLVNVPCRLLATYSYGVYLWHVPALYLIFTVLATRGQK